MEAIQSLWVRVLQINWGMLGKILLDIANQPIVCAMLPALVGWVLAVRVRTIVESNADALETRRLEGELADTSGNQNGTPSEPPNVLAAPTIQDKEAPESSGDTEPSEDTGPPENFAQGSKWIMELKKYVDEKAKNAKDGRKRRRYANIDRYDYRVLVLALAEAGEISAEDKDEINRAFTKWSRYRNGRVTVPYNMVVETRKLVRRLRRNHTETPDTILDKVDAFVRDESTEPPK